MAWSHIRQQTYILELEVFAPNGQNMNLAAGPRHLIRVQPGASNDVLRLEGTTATKVQAQGSPRLNPLHLGPKVHRSAQRNHFLRQRLGDPRIVYDAGGGALHGSDASTVGLNLSHGGVAVQPCQARYPVVL
jgi:hypothetical protein